MLFFTTISYAEYAEHALIVHRLSYWAPEYLTITNNWNNLCFNSAPSSLKSLSVITDINGKSTKDMEPEDFYAIIDKSSTFNITYITKIRGENKTFTEKLKKKNGKLHFEYRDYSRIGDEDFWFFRDGDERGSHAPKIGPKPSECTSIMADQNTDFFQFSTFDYMVAGDDYMIDLGLAQTFAKELEKKGLKYNPENPDLHLYLTKSSNANIESIYVPKIISTTKSTSYTKGKINIYYGNYNTWGQANAKTTGNSTTTIKDIGSTQAVVDGDLYTQVCLLDAKRMNDINPPIVWQLFFQRHYVKQFNPIEDIKKLRIAMRPYPSSSKMIIDKQCIKTYGFFFKEHFSKNGLIIDVADGSWADKNGIQPGYILKKANYDWGSESSGKGYEFQPTIHARYVEELIFNKQKIKVGYNENNTYYYFYIHEKYIEE